MRQSLIPDLNDTVQIPVYIFFSYVSVAVFDAGIAGLGYSQLAASIISWFCLLFQSYLCIDIQEAVFFPTWETFYGLGEYISIGS